MKHIQRTLALMIAIIMLLSAVPFNAIAEEILAQDADLLLGTEAEAIQLVSDIPETDDSDESETVPVTTSEVVENVEPELSLEPEAETEAEPEIISEKDSAPESEAADEEAFDSAPAPEPEALPDATPEVTPEITSEETLEALPEATPEAEPEVTPEITSEATLEVAPEATPEAEPEVMPETTPEAGFDPGAEILPETPEADVPVFVPQEAPAMDSLQKGISYNSDAAFIPVYTAEALARYLDMGIAELAAALDLSEEQLLQLPAEEIAAYHDIFRYPVSAYGYAGNISLGVRFSGQASDSYTQDYNISISRSGRYLLTIDASKYMSVGVYNGSTFVQGVGHACSGATSYWTIDLEAGNTYTFKIAVDNRYSSGYSDFSATLKMHIDGDHHDRAASLAYDVYSNFEVSYSNDYQIFTFTAIEGSRYRIHSSGSLSRTIEVCDENFTVIDSSEAYITGSNSFDLTLTPGKTYYLAIHGESYSYGSVWYERGSGKIKIECLDRLINPITVTIDKKKVDPGLNDGITFTIKSQYASKVRLLLNGDPYGDVYSLNNGSVVIKSPFHVSGSHEVQVQGYYNNGWSLLTEPIAISVRQREALDQPILSSIENATTSSTPNEDYTVHWYPLAGAEEYNVQIHSSDERIFNENVQDNSATIPGNILGTPGIYDLSIYGIANDKQQSSRPARAEIVVEDTPIRLSINTLTYGNTITWELTATNASGSAQYKFDIYNSETGLVRAGIYSEALGSSYSAPADGRFYAVVHVKDGNKEMQKVSNAVTISNHLSVDPESLQFNHNGGSADANVSCRTAWSAYVTDGFDWITISYNESRITIQADSNTSDEDRSGSVRVESTDGWSFDIPVLQKSYCRHEQADVRYYDEAGNLLGENKRSKYTKVDAQIHTFVIKAAERRFVCINCDEVLESNEVNGSLTVRENHNFALNARGKLVCKNCNMASACKHNSWIGGSDYHDNYVQYNNSVHLRRFYSTISAAQPETEYNMYCPGCGQVGYENEEGKITWINLAEMPLLSTALEEHSFLNGACQFCGMKQPKVTSVAIMYNGEDAGQTVGIDISGEGRIQLTANCMPENAQQKVTWTSKNAKIATVDKNGVVTAVAIGKTTITATAADGSKKTDTVDVQVGSLAKNIFITGKTEVVSGKSIKLKANVSPANTTNKAVTWTSSDESIATVNSSGKVTAQQVSTKKSVTITATAQDGSGVSAEYTVWACPLAQGVTIMIDDEQAGSKASINLKSDPKLQLSAVVLPDGAGQGVTWTSKNAKVATVSGTGLVTGLKAGTAVIVATAADGSGRTDQIKVYVGVPVKSIEIGGPDTLEGGKTAALSIDLQPSNATQKGVTWSTSDTSIATVSSSGKITGKKVTSPQKVIVFATAKDGSGVYGQHAIEILPPAGAPIILVNGAAAENAYIDLARSNTLQLGVQTSIENPSFIWKSSNTQVARVDENGLVTAASTGTCEIIVTDQRGNSGAIRLQVGDTSDYETAPGFTFIDGVENRDEGFNWQTSGGGYILPGYEEVPQVGQIYTFGMETAIKVESVQEQNGNILVTTSSPELYEILESINIEGTAALDFSQFRPASGVRLRSRSNQLVEVTVNADGLSASGDIPLEDPFSLNVSLDLDKPDVDYKFDMGFGNPFKGQPLINVRDAMLSLETGLNVHVGVGTEADSNDDDSGLDDWIEFKIPLGSIPVVGIPGLCAEVEVDLEIAAGGECYIEFGFSGLIGARVLNNRFHNITDLHPTMSAGLAGEAKVYGEIELDAEVFDQDIFSIGSQMGIQGEGSVDFRSNGMVCMDAKVFPFISLTAFDGTLIEEWLDLSVSLELMNADNAPLKWNVHFEDLQKVPECTWEKGTIIGTVANADNRTRYISGAKIEVEGADTPFYSDANGRYTAKVDTGSRRIRISADGYLPFESLETVLAGEVVYLETYLMVEGDEDEDATGTIGGTVTNAVTGMSISGVKVTARKGWNTTSGTVVGTTTTNSSGRYSLTLPIGNYTLLLEREGFVTGHINVAVTQNGNSNCHATLNPDGSSSIELGDLRIVLTWGATPSDLDSHLWGPTSNGANDYHIFYKQMSHYENGTRMAYLDVDDVSSYGPETTTVYSMKPVGTYNFYVHDFTNRSYSNTTAMANSGANVKVYMGEQLVGQYNVPTSGKGTVWHVFSFDAETGMIRGVNTWSNAYDPYSVGAH